jgi:hypothetical protein
MGPNESELGPDGSCPDCPRRKLAQLRTVITEDQFSGGRTSPVPEKTAMFETLLAQQLSRETGGGGVGWVNALAGAHYGMAQNERLWLGASCWFTFSRLECSGSSRCNRLG